MKPLIWAHRGASGSYPENTIPAFEEAIKMNSDGIELDIQLTKDGEMVVCHDETIDRTSNGSGNIKDYTLEELRQFNFNKILPSLGEVKIPTMKEVIDLIKPTNLLINIELKTTIYFYEGIEEKIINLVHEEGMEDRVIYSSFNHASIVRIQQLDKNAKTAFLYMDSPIDFVSYAKKHNVDAIHPALYNLQYPEEIMQAKKAGLEINVWPVNTKDHILSCMDIGVDGLITDYPDMAVAVVNGKGLSKEFETYLNNEIKPWLKDNVHRATIFTEDELHLSSYYAINPNEKASIVIVHGFCEFFGKYHEVAYKFYNEGYSVFFLELRGHGKSDREYPFDDQRVHVDNFDNYVEDVNAFIDQVVKPLSKTNKLFLFSHSMGGAVSSLYLEKYPDIFKCAVLSAPMMKINFGRFPSWTVTAISELYKARDKALDFAIGQHAFTGSYGFEKSNSMDRDRYIYQFYQRVENKDYQTWGSTIGWVNAAINADEELMKNANKVKTPILLLQAEKDVMVENDAQNEFAKKSQMTTLLEFKDAKHELYNGTPEIMKEFYSAVLDFYNAFAK